MMKSKRAKKRKFKEVPAYKKELGSHGIKVVNNWDKPKNISAFKVTKKENKRRKQREVSLIERKRSTHLQRLKWYTHNDPSVCCQMRFAASTPEPTDDDMAPMLLDTALSSSREAGGAAPVSAPKPTGKIVGTSTKLEKSYLRLTTFPKAQDVRPLPILQRSLQHIKAKYIKEEDFLWANEQLKAVRQDMTVQGIRSDFCVEVYETHARILLERGDLNEFNQCQSMIRTLTSTDGGGGGGGVSVEDDDNDEPWKKSDVLCHQTPQHTDEFQAYQLIYSLVQNSWTDLTKALGGTDTTGHSCQHAVLVVKSVIHNDYHGFFRLYESAPHLSAYLMDFLVKRVRSEAYDRIVASYRPTMGIEYFREALQFPNLAETRHFLKTSGAVFLKDTERESWVDCKASHAKQRRTGKS